jgi:hypothetical protein
VKNQDVDMVVVIRLDLSAHCVETEIRRQYDIRISRYFKAGASGDKADLEREIELLLEALENFDFKRLRSRHSFLAGSSHDDIRLIRDAGGRARIQHNGNIIDADHYL